MNDRKWFDVRIIQDPFGDEQPNFNGRIVAVAANVVNRIIQEEIWAQTGWPDGEKPLSQLLDEYMGREVTP